MTSGHQKLVKTKVVLTVDTEPSIAGAFRADEAHWPLIDEPVAGMVDGKSEGLGFLVETLSGHGLVATFFVETLHTRYFPDTVMGGYVDRLLRAGQDVQLHLHPCWLSFEDGKFDRSNPASDHCHELETGRLAALIGEGADRISSLDRGAPERYANGQLFDSAIGVRGDEPGRPAPCIEYLSRGSSPAGAGTGGDRRRARLCRHSRTAGNLLCRCRTGRARTPAPDAGHRTDGARADQPAQRGARSWKRGRGDRYAPVRVRQKARFPLHQPPAQSSNPGPASGACAHSCPKTATGSRSCRSR